jgi:hypothetical protein
MNSVESIVKIYGKLESPLRQDDFNIFSILNLEYDEVRLHSRILKRFIENDVDGFVNIIPSKYWINKIKPKENQFEEILIEVPVYSNNENLGDGRIDLLINFKGFSIIIENKIFAKDQENQLVKYHSYGEKFCDDFLLLYLTPLGKSPEDISIRFNDLIIPSLEINKHFYNISYRYHILNWLNVYRDEKKNNNLENGVLNQYINSLNKICGIMDAQQKERIIELLNDQAVRSGLSLIKSDIQTIENKIHTFWLKVAQHIEEKSPKYFTSSPSIKEGSIMFDIFGMNRGQANFYLEYRPNFEETPFIGIWLNNYYLNKVQDVILRYNISSDRGFLDKMYFNDLFHKDVIVNYINGNEKSDIASIVEKIEKYLSDKTEIIAEIRNSLKTTNE